MRERHGAVSAGARDPVARPPHSRTGPVAALVLAASWPTTRLCNDSCPASRCLDVEREREVARPRLPPASSCPGDPESGRRGPRRSERTAILPLGSRAGRRRVLLSAKCCRRGSPERHGIRRDGGHRDGGRTGERRFTIVSGAAFGIDAAAHRGALATGATTIAVLAGGVERPYPSSHAALIARIVEVGAVVSEVAPGSAPTKTRFLQRNRMIATMSRGTVVVEAGLRSGSLNTARTAAEHGRVVVAVPGPVTSMMSAGCHEAIRSGMAQLVTDAAEAAEKAIGDLLMATTSPSGARGPTTMAGDEARQARGSSAGSFLSARHSGHRLARCRPGLGLPSVPGPCSDVWICLLWA